MAGLDPAIHVLLISV